MWNHMIYTIRLAVTQAAQRCANSPIFVSIISPCSKTATAVTFELLTQSSLCGCLRHTQTNLFWNWSQELESNRTHTLSNAKLHSRSRTSSKFFQKIQHITAHWLPEYACVANNTVSNRGDDMFYANCPNFQCRIQFVFDRCYMQTSESFVCVPHFNTKYIPREFL